MASAFSGRTLLIATKHGKESVIAPALEAALGVRCIVANDFDTDRLGTFTGEVEREDDAPCTVRKKCLLAMQQHGCDLAVASEGAFGPHPSAFFLPADDELLICIDHHLGIEIIARELSTDTNFAAQEIHHLKDLTDFAIHTGFPEHGLILRAHKTDIEHLIKGIQDMAQLQALGEQLLNKHGRAYVETDMRAMMNPTRMRVIEKAAHQLAGKMLSSCPQCSTPGYSITEVVGGLPCSWCGTPTKSISAYIYQCRYCSHSEKLVPAGHRTCEDPMYCDVCNP